MSNSLLIALMIDSVSSFKSFTWIDLLPIPVASVIFSLGIFGSGDVGNLIECVDEDFANESLDECSNDVDSLPSGDFALVPGIIDWEEED